MLFMNEPEIDEAVALYLHHPVLSKATCFLSEYRDEVNRCSDGWPYWAMPVHAAKQLITLIQHPETATKASLRKAIGPIKSFYTKRGRAIGMKFPTVAL